MRKLGLIVLMAAVAVFFTFSAGAEYYDFGGETIILWDHGDFGDAGVNFEEGGVTPNRLHEAEELFNANIEIRDGGDRHARLLSGDSANDIWMVNNRDYPEKLGQNMLYPISEILDDEYFDVLHTYRRVAADIMSHEGITYGFGTLFQPPRMRFMMYNKELIEQAGLQDPYEHYEAGTWTWDTFEQYLEALRVDLDGDGTYDQYGMGPGYFATGWYSPMYFALTNKVHSTRIENGDVVFNMNSDEYIAALNKLVEWHAERELFGDVDFAEGTAAFAATTPAWLTGDEDFGFEWSVVPKPMGPNADEYAYTVDMINAWTIPLNSAHPEGKVQLINYLYPTDVYEDWYEELIGSIAPDRQAYEVMMRGFNEWPGDVDVFMGITDWPTMGDMGDIFDGVMSPREAMDASAPEIQGVLNSIIDQDFEEEDLDI